MDRTPLRAVGQVERIPSLQRKWLDSIRLVIEIILDYDHNDKILDSSKPDFSQLAMLQMMQAAGFPFLPPGAVSGSLPSFTGQIPPGMSDLFNPLLNSNLASSPQKRARTRITDDQLKVLR